MSATTPTAQIVLVTGPSGAGRTTAIRAFEDLGFEAVDNIPFSLLPRLFEGPPLARPMAIGLDVRNRDFSVDGVLALAEHLGQREEQSAELLYLDCEESELVRRYSETRRRHPLAPLEAPLSGIQREMDLLSPLRLAAHRLIETTGFTVHDLRAEIERAYGGPKVLSALTIASFSYKRGLPRGADLVFDCRFLRNPHWSKDLRALDGRDPRVAAYVAEDPRYGEFTTRLKELLGFMLPAFREEGKTHLSVAFGCTGGQHRSVALAEMMGKALEASGWAVSIRHRELERYNVQGTGPGKTGQQI